jgi:hypothetical protein
VLDSSETSCIIPVADVGSSGDVNVIWRQGHSFWSRAPVIVKMRDDSLLFRYIDTTSFQLADVGIANNLQYHDDTVFFVYEFGLDDDAYIKLIKMIDSYEDRELLSFFYGSYPCITYNSDYYGNLSDYAVLYIDINKYIKVAKYDFWWQEWIVRKSQEVVSDYICIDNIAPPTGFSYLFLNNSSMFHGFTYGIDWFSDYYNPEGYDIVLDTVPNNPIYPSIAYKQFRFHVVDYIWMEQTDTCYNIYHKRDDKYDPLGIEGVQQNGTKLEGYPNPFKDKVTINFTVNDFSEPAKLEIYNSLGMLVQKLSPSESTNGTYSFEWDGVINNGDYVQPGIYVVVCSTKKQKLVGKIFYLGK